MGMFSKGSSSPPPQMPPMQDNSGIEAMMAQFENMMMGAMGSIAQSQQAATEMMMQIQAPQLPQAPVPSRVNDIDWTEKQDQLKSKMKADYNIDQARRKGRTGTVLSSPLLDEEDATTTGSVLASSR